MSSPAAHPRERTDAMIIPLSSARSRRTTASPIRKTDGGPSWAPYMPTALASQLFPDEGEELKEGKMGLLDHLEELRRRLIRCCLAVVVGMLVAFTVIERLVNFVLSPSRRMLPEGARLIYTQPGEAFGFYVQVALIAGVLLAAPFIGFQVWRFIAP